MRQPSGTALRLIADAATRQPQPICHACRRLLHQQQQALAGRRWLHTSRPTLADAANASAPVGFLKRMRESLFGSDKSKRDAARREGVVARKDDGKPADQRYKPAKTWDGLPRIGSVTWVKEQKDPGVKYKGFVRPETPKLSSEQWDAVVHEAVVEATLLVRARRPIKHISYPHDASSARDVTIVPGPTEAATKLKAEKAGFEAAILDAIPRAVNAQAGSPRAVSAIPTTCAQPRNQWLSMPLRDSTLKECIALRILATTGHRVPDHVLFKARSVREMRESLDAREPTSKVAHAPKLKNLPLSAPNVAVYDRRRTPIDKEKDVGRWKVIEAELLARGLPVTGTRGAHAKARPYTI